MAPRADFECKPCGVKTGSVPVIHQNLPVSSVFCPACGKRRGFKRLYNAVQVSTRGHRVARFVDKRLQPAYDKKSGIEAGAKSFEQAHNAAMDRAYEEAPPEARKQMAGARKQGMIGRGVPAAAAWGAIDPAARADSRAYTFPMVQRTVRPEYQR